MIVIGGSAGALEALCGIVRGLPPDLEAAVFVVVHVMPVARSRLPEILARRTELPVRHARDGDEVLPGRILIAPPDQHLLLRDGCVELNRGPRENSTRPAIDLLFRTAADTFGPRVCGVIVSGNLDDGSAGLQHVVASGGVGVVQDPAEALHPEMPRNALARCTSCHVLAAVRIPALLRQLAGAGHVAEQTPMNEDRKTPPAIADQAQQIGAGDSPGWPTGLTCPECHGVLWSSADSADPTLHCRIGHSYSLETLQSQRRLEIEAAMGAAMRALHEEASLARHIAARAASHGRHLVARRFERRAETALNQARVMERLLEEPVPLPTSMSEDADDGDDRRRTG